MSNQSYLLHNLIKELTNSNESALFVGYQARNVHDLKEKLLDEICKLVENNDLFYLGEKKEYADINISFSQQNNTTYTLTVDLPKNLLGVVKLEELVKNVTFNRSDNSTSITISQYLYDKINTIEVYERIEVYQNTFIDYLQFSADKSNFTVNNDNYTISGFLSGIASNEDTFILFKDNNDNILCTVRYSDFSPSNAYVVFYTKFKIGIYEIAIIPVLVREYIQPVLIDNGNDRLTFSATYRLGVDTVNLAVKTSRGNSFENEKFIYKKTYMPLSYKNSGTLITYTYDLALVMLTFLAEYRITRRANYKDYVVKQFNYMKKLINSRNAFNFSYPSSGSTSNEYIRNGAVAWALEALAKAYLEITELQTAENRNFIRNIADYLISEIQPNGLVRGGYGIYTANGDFDPSYEVPWFSTEHNIDTYFALRSAHAVLYEPYGQYSYYYLDIASELRDAIYINLYQEDRLLRGYQDNAGALDIHTWGTLFIYKTGGSVETTYSNYRYLDGYFLDKPKTSSFVPDLYKPYSNELGYPGASTVLWFEGYFQALYTKLLIYKNYLEFEYSKDKYQLFLRKKLLPYSLGNDEIYEIGEFPSIASACWFIFFYNLFYNGLESFWY